MALSTSACKSFDSDLALAIKLQAQFDQEISLTNNKDTNKKFISLLDSDDEDDKLYPAKENLDFEFAKNLQKELNSDIIVSKTTSKSKFQNKKVVSLLDSDDEDDKYDSAKENLDLEFAKNFEKELNSDTSVSKASSELQCVKNIVDDQWELIDPNPNVHSLFLAFDEEYFYGRLKGVEVRWSPKMTLCAGLCCYEGRGGLCSIRLSTPLLKLRPRRDLVQTLLHEMIHAYLFVTGNNRDHDAHGSEFHKHMNRINTATGTKITVYHSFHDEVNLYKVHWWRCNGSCREKPPYFGYVKRSMNRPPQPADFWWKDHQTSCGGTYTKIKEPDSVEKKRKNVSDNKSAKKGKHSQSSGSPKPSTSKDIRSFFDEKKSSSQNISNVFTLSDDSSNTNMKRKHESSPVKKSGDGAKGGFTKMNSSSTVTIANFKNGNNYKKPETIPTCNTGSNVFTINSLSTSSPKKKIFNSFSGQGRSLGSS